ncbi:hypothetical protein [Paucisalibacillus sp. EB02]|uniref:hypothetical protein n=1 Tax=Paucisalibacillus sp. EB02 TaxID=1347087 RepID=UPI0004B1DDA2|nr:hypothetical protein [Paucisalibacillus sp. EB02]
MRSIKLTYIAFSLIFLGLLFGCSREISLEDEIEKILESSEGKDYERVIDYDIKGEFIVVIYKSKSNEQLNVGFIRSNNSELDWETGMGGPELAGGYSFISYPLIVNIIIPEEQNIKEVKVFGETAKFVRFSDDIEYWISFTEKTPSSLDVEYLK